MKNSLKWLLPGISMLLIMRLSAQKILPSGNIATSKNIIEKITTNPATRFTLEPDGKDNDGYATIYIDAAYAGQVKEITYHVYNLPHLDLNPFITIPVSGDKIIIPKLRRNIYEITELKLNNGTVVKTISTAKLVNGSPVHSVNIFNVFCCDARFAHFIDKKELLKNMEGPNVALLKSNYEKFPLPISNYKNGALSKVARETGVLACQTNNWVMQYEIPGGVFVMGQPYNVYALHMRNTCNNVEMDFHCNSPHNGVGNSFPGEIFHYISGSACQGTLQLSPSSSAQTMQLIGTNSYDCAPPPPCDLGVSIVGNNECTGQVLTGTAYGTSALSGFYSTLWTGPGGISVTNTDTLRTVGAGTYTYSFTSFDFFAGTSCNAQKSVVVSASIAAPVLLLGTAPSCASGNGTFTITNYNAAYTYTITTTAGAGTATRSGNTVTAPVGTYSVKANDFGCISTASITLSAGASPAQPLSAGSTPPVCGAANGFITLSNFNAAYTYTFTTVTGGGTLTQVGSTNSFTGIPGTYTITATSGACSSPASANIAIAAGPVTPAQPLALLSIAPVCGASKGSIILANFNAAYTYTFTTISGGGTLTQVGSTNSFTGIPGIYTITATSGACSSPPSANITILAGPVTPAQPLSAGSTPPVCGAANGFITLSNFNAAYTYTFTTVSGGGTLTQVGSTNNFTGIPGIYTITATSGACSSPASANITIAAGPVTPGQPLSAGSTPPVCGAANGFITLSNFNAAYTYTFTTISGGGTLTQVGSTNSFTGIPGTYTITATSGACSSPASANIAIAAGPVTPGQPLSAGSTPPVCGAANGFITLSNFNAAYTYTFTTISGGGTLTQVGSTNSFAGIPGTYTITATSGACSSPASANIIIAAGPVTPGQPLSAGSTPPVCGAANGFITLSNFNAAYTYTFTTVSGGGTLTQVGSTNSFTGIPGTYTITATSGACSSPASANITIAAGPVTPVVATSNVTQPDCITSTGSITISSIAGATYSFDDGITWQASNTKSFLNAGTYKLKITSSALCVSNTLNVVILPFSPVTAAGAIGVDESICAAILDPAIILETTAPSGGTSLQYIWESSLTGAPGSWSPISGAASITYDPSTISTTTYYRRGVRETGCTVYLYSNAVKKEIKGAVIAAASSNQTICSKDSLTLTASGGTAYSWAIGSAAGLVIATTPVVKVRPLTVTTYYITVSNAAGCSDTKSVIVNAPRNALELTNIVDICKGVTTTVNADDPAHPIAGYTYRWLAPAIILPNTTQQVSVTPNDTTYYTVERTTADGCKDTATSVVNVIQQPVLGTAAKTDASCTGTNDGSITINATSPGGLVMEYSIDGTTWQASNIFSNLPPNSYSVLVRNKNGICQAISGTSVTILRLSGPVSTITAPTARCATEDITFQADPVIGATYAWTATGGAIVNGASNGPVFTASWPIPAENTTPQATVVISLNGCTATYSKAVTITQHIFAAAGPDKIICKGGQTTIGLGYGQTGPTSAIYSWYPTDGSIVSGATANTAVVQPKVTTTYTVSVSDPINGCTKTSQVTVTVNVAANPRSDAGPDMIVSDAITSVSIGGPTTTPKPSAAATFTINYAWSGIEDVSTANLDDASAKITTFYEPSGMVAPSSLTYVLTVIKFYKATDPDYPNQSCPMTDTMVIRKQAVLAVSLSGNLWDNTNGNNLIDAGLGEVKTNGGKPMVAVLTDNTGKVIATTPIAADGSFTFTGVPANTTGLKVLADTATPAIGSTYTIPLAPSGWVYLGSQSGSAGNTNTTKGNGYVNVNTGTIDITDVNIGFDQLPTPIGIVLPSQTHPAPGVPIPITPSNFSGNDPEDGTNLNLVAADSVHYTAFPSQIDSITIGGIVYKAATWPSAGVSVLINTPVSIYPVAGNVTVDIPFKVTDQAGQQSPATAHVVIPFTSPVICFSIKALLQGSLVGNGGGTLMRDNLRVSPFTGKNYIPKNDPYSTPAYSVKFTPLLDGLVTEMKTITDSATMFASHADASQNITDWVFIQLRDKNNSSNVISTRSVLVQRDGTFVDVNGSTCIRFPLTPYDDYYVAIRHRNHMGTMTAAPIAKTALTTGGLLDFTTMAAAQLYDRTDFPAVNYNGLEQATVNGVKALWAGNANQDSKVKYTGTANDIDIINAQIQLYGTNITSDPSYDFGYGYYSGDVNLNSKVKYTGAGNDVDFINLWVTIFPLNTNGDPAYDFKIEQLPSAQ